MSDNPYQSTQSDLAPLSRPALTQGMVPTEFGQANARFSLLSLLLLITCAAVNAAAYAQLLGVLPAIALVCNAVLFVALFRDLRKHQDERRLMVHCALAVLILVASAPLMLFVLVCLSSGLLL